MTTWEWMFIVLGAYFAATLIFFAGWAAHASLSDFRDRETIARWLPYWLGEKKRGKEDQ